MQHDRPSNNQEQTGTTTTMRRAEYSVGAVIGLLAGLLLVAYGVITTASAQSLANVTLNWVSPGASAPVNTPVPFEVGATGLADGTFTYAWTIDGTTTFTDSATVDAGSATFNQTYTFGEVGRFGIASQLTDGPSTLAADFRQVLVTGTLDITRTAVSTGEATTFVVTMPELRTAGASEGAVYNLVINYGDAIDSFERLTVAPGTTTVTTTHQYLIGGTFTTTARVELIDTYNNYVYDDADVLATGSVQTVVTQQIYMPIIGTDPAPPVIPACGDDGNNGLLSAKPIDNPALRSDAGWQCRGSLEAVEQGRSNYYLITLRPSETLQVTVDELASDADYDLYLYNEVSATATSVATSAQRGSMAETIIYTHTGDRVLNHYPRIVQYTQSASQHTYLLTIKISSATP